MRRYDEMGARELLGVAGDATAEEIRAAYERLVARFAPGALALYSIADRDEQDALQRRLRAAYLELLDEAGADPAHPGPAPAEPPETAGAEAPPAPAAEGATFSADFLRRAREARALSLEALSHRTRIRRHLLEALEAERFSELPQRVFVRGFVFAVARELGLDPERAWDGYGARWGAWAAAQR